MSKAKKMREVKNRDFLGKFIHSSFGENKQINKDQIRSNQIKCVCFFFHLWQPTMAGKSRERSLENVESTCNWEPSQRFYLNGPFLWEIMNTKGEVLIETPIMETWGGKEIHCRRKLCLFY